MNDKRTDISQINKYLNGELDAAAMHRLEREAQDDPFLMEALEGYENAASSQQLNLYNLESRLQQRIAEKPARKIIPWKYYAAAAAILVFLTLGYEAWIGKQQPPQQKLTAANLPAPADHVIVKTDTAANAGTDKSGLVASAMPVPKHIPVQPEIKPAAPPLQAAAANAIAPGVYKADTVEYKASDYKVNNKATLDDLLKKMPGVEVNPDGSVTRQGQAITKVKLNGKDVAGGDVQQAIKTLPADIIEKAQVVDDYGDQARRTAKVKNDSITLKEVTVAGYGTLTKTDINGNATASQTLLGKVRGVNVTTPPRISGTVYDQLGLALPGVSVLLNGTRNVVVTDDKGRFTIPVTGQATLNVNYLGFESAQIKASPNDSLQIKLKPVSASLSEVVITKPYSKSKKVAAAAQPRIGWDEYNKYLKKTALSDKSGTVNLSFTVNPQGELSNIKALKGSDETINQQAIDLVKNGPAWYGDSSGEVKTVKLKIRFRKK